MPYSSIGNKFLVGLLSVMLLSFAVTEMNFASAVPGNGKGTSKDSSSGNSGSSNGKSGSSSGNSGSSSGNSGSSSGNSGSNPSSAQRSTAVSDITEKISLEETKLSEITDEKEIKKLLKKIEKLQKKLDRNLEKINDDILSKSQKNSLNLTLKEKNDKTKFEVKIKNKLNSKVFDLTKSEQPEIDAQKIGLDFKNGKTKLVIELSDSTESILNKIGAIAEIDHKNKNHVQITVDLDDLSKITSILGVDNVRPPSEPVFFEETISEGVYFINADLVQYSGITGKGTKVAIIDSGFDINNSEISSNIFEAMSFRTGIDSEIGIEGLQGESLHGTAVAEIVTDVSPDVKLFLYSMKSDVEFVSAVDKAQKQGVDIIVMSAGWPNLPTDGTSHITQKVEEAVQQGITFVVPSGNFATKHWEGNFSDVNKNGWHEFTNYDEGLSVNVTDSRILDQTPITAHLLWDVGLGDIVDFDLVVIDPAGKIVDYSSEKQTTKNDKLSEYIYFIPETPGLYALGVVYQGEKLIGVQNPVNLEIFTVNDDVEHPIAYSSLSVPADAKGAIVVGAVNHLDGKLESFSSQGPTNNGLLAPHVVGPDGVTTLAFGGEPFFGTSATAPYVAGIAALMLEIDPHSSPEDLLTEIQQNTVSSLFSLENQQDLALGYGRASALFIVENYEVMG